MKPTLFLCIALSASLLPLSAQEPDEAPAPASAAPAPAPASAPTARPSAPPAAPPAKISEDAMRYAGIPLGIVKQMPALEVLFALTAEQQTELKKAYDETVGEATKTAATNEDKRQAQAIMQRARKAFESTRDSILTDPQHSLIRNVVASFKSAQAKVKESAAQPGGKRAALQEVFYQELKPTLSQEEAARLTAAGVKLP